MPLNRQEIMRSIGDIDDVTVAEIIATGAIAEEAADAHARQMTRKLLDLKRPENHEERQGRESG